MCNYSNIIPQEQAAGKKKAKVSLTKKKKSQIR